MLCVDVPTEHLGHRLRAPTNGVILRDSNMVGFLLIQMRRCTRILASKTPGLWTFITFLELYNHILDVIFFVDATLAILVSIVDSIYHSQLFSLFALGTWMAQLTRHA